MRNAGNFNPEWGYLAPKPGFIRTVRMALLAGAIGTVSGMAVAVALIERAPADLSVAARTMAQPNESSDLPKPTASVVAASTVTTPAATAELLESKAQEVSSREIVAHAGSSTHAGEDRQLRNSEAESHSAATFSQPTGVAGLAEAPAAVSDHAAEIPAHTTPPSAPTSVSRVQQPAGAAALAEAPALRDDATETSSEAMPAPSPKKATNKVQVARVRTPRTDRNSLGRDNGRPFDLLPLIGRTILGANPFPSNQVR